MSKASALKDKIANKKDSPAREFINGYANEEADKKTEGPKKQDNLTASENKNNKNAAAIRANDDSNSKDDIKNASDNDSDNSQDIFSVIDNLIEKEKSKPAKEYVGFYLDADVHEGLNNLCKKSKQKWVKSKIVNDILRSMLRKAGVNQKQIRLSRTVH